MKRKRVMPVVIYSLFVMVCVACAGTKFYSDYENEKQQSVLAMKSKEVEKKELTNMNRLVNNDDCRMYELINKTNKLEKNYTPDNLVYPAVNTVIKGKDNRNLLRRNAAKSLEGMFAAAKKDGVILYLHSGFRSYDTQNLIYTTGIKKQSSDSDDYIAKPGESEHQTGLAADLSSKEANFKLDDSFEKSAAYKWLTSNSYKYGFTLRYPKNKENITGYKYEPWHYRFVGKDIAQYLQKDQLTLEEFYKKID